MSSSSTLSLSLSLLLSLSLSLLHTHKHTHTHTHKHTHTHTHTRTGLTFLKNKENAYDVIIIDSSDPDGPASGLFGEEFYKLVHRALKPGGVTCSQAGILKSLRYRDFA